MKDQFTIDESLINVIPCLGNKAIEINNNLKNYGDSADVLLPDGWIGYRSGDVFLGEYTKDGKVNLIVKAKAESQVSNKEINRQKFHRMRPNLYILRCAKGMSQKEAKDIRP